MQKLRGLATADVLIPPCSMQFVLSFSKVKGHIKDGTRRKRLPGPENFCWVYDVRNKGGRRKRMYTEVIGRPTEASKKVDDKKGSLFGLICLLLFVCCSVVQCVPMTLSLVHRVCSFRECIFVDDDSPHFWHRHPSH